MPFGIDPNVLALRPQDVLLDEYRRRQEVFQAQQAQREYALAQKRLALHSRQVAAQERAVRLRAGMGAAGLAQRERLGMARLAAKVPTAPRMFTGEVPSGYQAGYGRYGERILEKIKPTKALKPTYGEKEFMEGFQDAFIDKEGGLSGGEESQAQSLIDQYNEYRRKYNQPEVEIVQGRWPWSKASIRMKEITEPVEEGEAYAAERLEERVKPEELRIWETKKKQDKYGYHMGEMKMARDGTMMEYVGNNKWLPSMR